MQQIHTLAIVLRRTNYQEADRILTVLTPEQGKLSVIAKGARRAKSKLAGGIELLAVNDLTFIKGKGEMYTLTASRVKTAFASIAKDIDRTMKAYEYLKLIDKILESHAHERGYFDAVCGALEGLDIEQLNPQLTDVWFYLHALDLSGLRPDLRKDTDGNSLEENENYQFDVADMQFRKDKDGMFTSNHIKLMRLAIVSSSAKKLSNLFVEPTIVQACFSLCKSMAEYNLL